MFSAYDYTNVEIRLIDNWLLFITINYIIISNFTHFLSSLPFSYPGFRKIYTHYNYKKYPSLYPFTLNVNNQPTYIHSSYPLYQPLLSSLPYYSIRRPSPSPELRPATPTAYSSRPAISLSGSST